MYKKDSIIMIIIICLDKYTGLEEKNIKEGHTLICPQCQKQNQEGANYCPYCGYSFQEVNIHVNRNELSNKQHFQNTSFIKKRNEDGQQLQMQMPPNQTQTVKFFSQFMTFFINGLKNPTQYAKYQGGARYVFGYIILVLAALFHGLALAMVYQIFDRALSFFSSSSYSFFSTFVVHLLIYIAILALAIGLIFVFVRNIMRINVKFNHVIGRFGTLAIVLLLCNITALLFTITGFIGLQSFANGLGSAVLFFIIMMTFQMYTDEAKKRFEPLYGSMIIAALITILNLVFSNSTFVDIFL